MDLHSVAWTNGLLPASEPYLRRFNEIWAERENSLLSSQQITSQDGQSKESYSLIQFLQSSLGKQSPVQDGDGKSLLVRSYEEWLEKKTSFSSYGDEMRKRFLMRTPDNIPSQLIEYSLQDIQLRLATGEIPLPDVLTSVELMSISEARERWPSNGDLAKL